ncbi:hypothetical protein GGF46_002225 [Coemansia sp. RSA 552]|nr:hypothetical protein GGF46_002225 [Coemansia sp. RSA 552]
MGEDVSAVDILLGALRKTPPVDASAVLARVAEARSIRSGVYLKAIIDAISKDAATAKLHTHYASHSVRESLIDAIAMIETGSVDRYIDPQVVIELYQSSKARRWDLDAAVLRDAAVYLADSSYNTVCSAIERRGASEHTSTRGPGREHVVHLETDGERHATALKSAAAIRSEAEQSSGGSDILDVTMEIAHALSEHTTAEADQSYYMQLIRAMCTAGRTSDAEWLFAAASKKHSRYTGAIYASMMAMCYRAGDQGRADALFDEFLARWGQDWKDMAHMAVMSDKAGFEAEKWRLKHEEGVEHPSTKVMLVDDLRRIRTQAAAPFVCRALAFIRRGDGAGAKKFMSEARTEHFVLPQPAQLDMLVGALLEIGCSEQVYKQSMEFLHNENTDVDVAAASQVMFPVALSGSTLQSMASNISDEAEWTRVWAVVDGSLPVTRAGSSSYMACLMALLWRALELSKPAEAIQCAQRIMTIASRDSQVTAAIPDAWIGGVFRFAQGLPRELGTNGRHPLVDIASALIHDDISSHNPRLDDWNSRVAKHAASMPQAESSSATIVDIQAIFDHASKYRGVSRPPALATEEAQAAPADASQQQGQVDRFSTAELPPIKVGTPYADKMEWYRAVRRRVIIPDLEPLAWLVRDSIQRKDLERWTSIIRDHLPGYLEALEKDDSPGGPARRKSYIQRMWSLAIQAYAAIGDIECAMEYYRGIVLEGSYPSGQGLGTLLKALIATKLPLPVLPKGWDGPEVDVCGMKPADPPRGEHPSDAYIIPVSQQHRKQLVAEMGLAMVYASLRQEIWPTTFLYNVVFWSLINARTIGPMRQLFETVIPRAARKMPARFRINPNFMLSPVIWSTAISGAVACGERALAEYWFKEYRMFAMPTFREESSAYSRFANRGWPKYSRLFLLARPYYLIPRIEHPAPKDGTAPVAQYDLREVEVQLEMDRLRALDKLPLAVKDALQMLKIYTQVDEHRDMPGAEVLADEVRALSQDKSIPFVCRPRGSTDLVYLWKLMVTGYLSLLQQQQQELSTEIVDPSDLEKVRERIAFWYRRYTVELERAGITEGDPVYFHSLLNSADLEMARAIYEDLAEREQPRLRNC